MEPGLTNLHQAVATLGYISNYFIMYEAIIVPVLPNPALQCIATGLSHFSIYKRNSFNKLLSGSPPSLKTNSLKEISIYIKTLSLYNRSFNLITVLILLERHTFANFYESLYLCLL